MLALFFLFVWIPLSALFRGISVAVFWNWFIAGQGAAFEGSAPTLNAIQALGLSLVISFLTYEFNSSDDNKDPEDVIAGTLVKVVALYLMYWVMAIIFHSIMA